MEITAPSCSVYACHDAVTFVLLPDDEHNIAALLPTDSLCARHWLQLRSFDPERAYRYVSVRYAGTEEGAITSAPAADSLPVSDE